MSSERAFHANLDSWITGCPECGRARCRCPHPDDMRRCDVCTERCDPRELKDRTRSGHFVEVCQSCRDEFECPVCAENICDNSCDRFDDPREDYRWVCEECASERGRER